MLLPKRVKYRRVQRGRMTGKAMRGNRPQGGFNRGPRPAAPAAPKEGGNN